MSSLQSAPSEVALVHVEMQDNDTDNSMASEHDSAVTNITPISSDGEDEDDDDDDVDYRLDAKPLFDFISKHAKKASQEVKESGQLNVQDFGAFKAFWRAKFDDWRAERAVTNDGADVYITTPPLRLLEIEILDDKEPHECPCCLADGGADIVIRAPDGITEDIFLKTICDDLYGEHEEEHDLPLREVYDGGLVVRDFNYMMHDEGMLYTSSYERERIWLYCSGANAWERMDDSVRLKSKI